MVDIHVKCTVPEIEELTDEEKEIMNKVIIDAEKQFKDHLRKVITDLKSHDQESKELIEQAVRQCRQAKGEVDRDCCIDELHTIIEKRIPKVPERYIVKLVGLFMLTEDDIVGVHLKHSVMIRCRCKTTDGLLDLDKLVDSHELDELFSLIMTCLINQPATASVRISREGFKRCLTSLNADAG